VKRTDTDRLVRNSTVVVCTCSNVILILRSDQINDSNVLVQTQIKLRTHKIAYGISPISNRWKMTQHQHIR
jgi:hypothetical protein